MNKLISRRKILTMLGGSAAAILSACNGTFVDPNTGQRYTVAPLQLEPVGKPAAVPVVPVQPTAAAPAATAVPGAPTATPAPAFTATAPAKPVATSVPGTPAPALTPVGVKTFQPPAVFPMVVDAKVISIGADAEKQWWRILQKNDGVVRQDVIASEEMGERPAYEVEFTLPTPIPGGDKRIYRGVRGVLMKGGTVLANHGNGIPVTLEAGATYKVVMDPGNNNSFSLELVVPVDKTPTAKRPYIISESADETRVVYNPDGRVYMDLFHEGMPAFRTIFVLPKDMTEKRRVFQGNNAVLAKVLEKDSSGKITKTEVLTGTTPDGNKRATSRAQNVLVEMEPGETYVVDGGDGNGGFALEMPKG